MTPRVQATVGEIAGALSAWEEVEAVTLMQSGDDRYDPYFFLSLDVYTSSQIRPADKRREAYGRVTAYESSGLTHKDRFMAGELPIRVEYKLVSRFSELVAAAETGQSGLRDSGTYSLFRLGNAEKLFARTDWLDDLRSRLSTLPKGFWVELRKTVQDSAEHTYADLKAAAVRDDSLYFTVSAGRFLSAVCSLLFAVNEKFEPGARYINSEIDRLHTVPDSFPANLENFLDRNSLSMTQRAELAELMVTNVMSLYRTDL